MKKITVKEHRKILLEMLLFIDDLCKKNGINYSVICGTAIGCLRHKGFIPWDDDIDIILNHDDYIILQKVLTNMNSEKYFLLDSSASDNYYPFMKVIDKRTTLIEEGCKPIKDYGAYVDIFEYNNAPNGKIKRTVYYYRVFFLKKLIAGLAWDSSRKDHRILLFFRYMLASMFGKEHLIKRYQKLCRKYDNYDCNYMLSNWPTYGLDQEIQEKKNFKSFMDAEFEKNSIMISKNIHEILTNTFGDYMELPPENKRKSNHKMQVYWK